MAKKQKNRNHIPDFYFVSVLPIVWIPFQLFVIGPLFSRRELAPVAIIVAVVAALLFFLGECFLLVTGIKKLWKFIAIMGVLSSLLLLLYAYIAYSFSFSPDRFTF